MTVGISNIVTTALRLSPQIDAVRGPAEAHGVRAGCRISSLNGMHAQGVAAPDMEMLLVRTSRPMNLRFLCGN